MSDRPALLFLCHRIPFPPDKGDKIRSWHLLRHLAGRFRVHLGTFVDDPQDWQYLPRLEDLCEQVHAEPLSPARATLRSLRGLLTGEPLTLPYYASRRLQRWVRCQVADHGVDRVMVYSSAMARFVPGDLPWRRRVIDFVDVDSDKWRQYAQRHAWPRSWIYRREGERLLAWDRRVAQAFDASLFVSAAEAALFRRLAPEVAERVGFYNNGVDSDYFSPAHDFDDPYPPGSRALVFTGAMDYWPNVDAVCWFVEEVMPRLRERVEGLRFCIVGARPDERVRRLERHPDVLVTGRVPDVRPYLAHALAAVAPMRVARGVQNKVLEAMAMARPVLVSPQGLDGIEAAVGEEVLLGETPDAFAGHVLALLAGEHAGMGAAARQRVLQDFNWDRSLPSVTALLDAEEAA